MSCVVATCNIKYGVRRWKDVKMGGMLVQWKDMGGNRMQARCTAKNGKPIGVEMYGKTEQRGANK